MFWTRCSRRRGPLVFLHSGGTGTAHEPLAHGEQTLGYQSSHLTDQTTKAVRPTGTAFFEEVWGPPPGVVTTSNASPVVWNAQEPYAWLEF